MTSLSGWSATTFGTSRVIAELERLTQDVPKELDKALFSEAQKIFRKSQRLVPVDRSYLKQSGIVEGPKNHEVLISYGGTATPYAAIVHERIVSKSGKKIKYSRPGKSAKYLERPFMDALPGMEERFRKILEEAANGKKSPDASNTPDQPTGGDA